MAVTRNLEPRKLLDYVGELQQELLKDDCYKPKCLKDLLSYITVGKDLSHEVIKEVTEEIKLNHTKNFALDKSGELTQNISSNFSLNDYGFNIILNKYLNNEPKLFFHGHATENAGGNQREQQNNTAHILRDFKYDTLGLTVLKEHVANVEHHRRYLSKYSGLMSFTKMEELILSSLQFDASYFKTLSLEQNVHNIETSDLISSNQFIVKSDIKRSQQFIANSLNKKDLEYLGNLKKPNGLPLLPTELVISDTFSTESHTFFNPSYIYSLQII